MKIFSVLTTSPSDRIDERVDNEDEDVELCSSSWISFNDDANFSIFDKIAGNGECTSSGATVAADADDGADGNDCEHSVLLFVLLIIVCDCGNANVTKSDSE